MVSSTRSVNDTVEISDGRQPFVNFKIADNLWRLLTLFMFVFSGISQFEFETVIPKQENAYVLIVSGKHKGQVIILSTRFIETDFLMIKD